MGTNLATLVRRILFATSKVGFNPSAGPDPGLSPVDQLIMSGDPASARLIDQCVRHGQPVVISEKSPFYAICPGQQDSPEEALER